MWPRALPIIDFMQDGSIRYPARLKYLAQSREAEDVIVSWEGRKMAVATPSQQPLIECDASETDEVSLAGKSAVAMTLKMRGKPSEMIGLYFEHREQAEQLCAWLKGEREQQQLRFRAASIAFANITTGLDFPNHRIVRNLGVVSGLTVRAADPGARLTSGLKH